MPSVFQRKKRRRYHQSPAMRTSPNLAVRLVRVERFKRSLRQSSAVITALFANSERFEDAKRQATRVNGQPSARKWFGVSALTPSAHS